MIDHVKIGAMTYKVVLKQDDDMIGSGDEGKAVRLSGVILYHSLTIALNRNDAPEKHVEVVVHEAIHGILAQAGQDVPEAAVRALGYGLVALIRDNPHLVSLIQTDHQRMERIAQEVVRNNGQATINREALFRP